MKKTFQLHIEGKNPNRVLEAVKHELRKYVKRERRRDLPEGADFWDFDCKFGPTPEAAEPVHLSALTARDWRENCDRTRTDRDVNLREAGWYGARLRRNFRPAGLGFWIRRGAPLTTWEMETAAI